MSVIIPRTKKPKLEAENGDADDNEMHVNSVDEQEEALVALIEHRIKEVDQLRRRLLYYQSQLDVAEKRLCDSESKLAQSRCRNKNIERRQFIGPNCLDEGSSSRKQLQPLPQLVIPSAIVERTHLRNISGSSVQVHYENNIPLSENFAGKEKENKCQSLSSEIDEVEIQEQGILFKLEEQKEQKQHKELISLIRSTASPNKLRFHSVSQIASRHKRRLRSLVLCPSNDELFVTSALNGTVKLWQIQSKGSEASLLSTTDCVSQKQKRWPEDIAWHPQGNCLISVHTADEGDSQVSVLDLNRSGEGRVRYLEEKPHIKGVINNVVFTPWEDRCFITGGSDHAVVCWREDDRLMSWKPKLLHRNLHSSAVMGVSGTRHKQMVVSVGADKKIIGFDLGVGKPCLKDQIDSKCMSILPNPCDFNLFMVQTGTPGRQLRLFDIRLRQTEIHGFGWKQENSESQSALINQAWSADGLYLSSGSSDPIIHIFDIRYSANTPSQSIPAHQKRVFKAVWHHSLPLLISISSDLTIGLHRIT